MSLAVALMGAGDGGSYEGEAARAARLGFAAFVPTYDETRDPAALAGVRAGIERLGTAPVMLNAYTNLIHPEPATRARNVARVQEALRAASELGCPWVNTMAGTRDPALAFWAYHPDNFGDDAWRCLGESVRQALAGTPEATAGLTLEPYMLTPLRSIARLRRIVEEIASPRLRLVLDPVNLISPLDYHRSDAVLREMFRELGEWVVAVHAKDHYLHRACATVRIDERIPGEGELDYATLLRCLDTVPDASLVIEHLKADDQILAAKGHIREVARRLRIPLDVLDGAS